MEFEVINKVISVGETLHDGFDEQPVDSDFTLPDYYPDIAAVLKCSLKPIIQSRQLSGDRVTVDGISVISLLYLDDDRQCLHSLEFTKPFTSVFTLKSGQDISALQTWAKTNYVNCRAISPRRLDVHGSFSVKLKAKCEGGIEIVSDITGEGVQTRKSRVNFTVPRLVSEKSFTVSEVIDLGGENYSIEKLIRNEVFLTLTDSKTLANKIILKGEAAVSSLYVTDLEEGTTQKVKNIIPFSQIIDAEGITEEDICDINLSVLSCDVKADTNQNGETRLIDITVKIGAAIQTFKTGESEFITDAYSTAFPVELETKRIDVEHLEEIKAEKISVKESFDLPSDEIAELVDMWCEIALVSTDYLNGVTTLNSRLTTHMISRDFEGNISYYERTGDIIFDFEDGSNHVISELEALNVDFSKTGANQCEIHAEVAVKRYCYVGESVLAVVNAEADRDKAFEEESITLKIYFAKSGESIWEVAKACHTSIGAVMEENSLGEDIVSKDTMLLVPLY